MTPVSCMEVDTWNIFSKNIKVNLFQLTASNSTNKTLQVLFSKQTLSGTYHMYSNRYQSSTTSRQMEELYSLKCGVHTWVLTGKMQHHEVCETHYREHQ